jgi:hypothetical protein
MEARRPDLVFFDRGNGRDLFVNVVGSSPLALSYRECYVPGGAVVRAAAHKVAFSRQVLAHQPPGWCSSLSLLTVSGASTPWLLGC